MKFSQFWRNDMEDTREASTGFPVGGPERMASTEELPLFIEDLVDCGCRDSECSARATGAEILERAGRFISDDLIPWSETVCDREDIDAATMKVGFVLYLLMDSRVGLVRTVQSEGGFLAPILVAEATAMTTKVSSVLSKVLDIFSPMGDPVRRYAQTYSLLSTYLTTVVMARKLQTEDGGHS